MKITFKKEPKAIRLSAVHYPFPDTLIKVDGKAVGVIVAPTWLTEDNLWGVSLALVKKRTKQDPDPFRWHKIMRRFESELDARIFVKEKLEKCLDYYGWFLYDLNAPQ